MRIKERLNKIWEENSKEYNEFIKYLKLLEDEMERLAREGITSIFISESHKLHPILKYEKALIEWLTKEELYWDGMSTNAYHNKLQNIMIKFIDKIGF